MHAVWSRTHPVKSSQLVILKTSASTTITAVLWLEVSCVSIAVVINCLQNFTNAADQLPKCVWSFGPVGHNVRYYLDLEYLQERSADLINLGKYL